MSGAPEIAIMRALQAALRSVDTTMYDARTALPNVDFVKPDLPNAYQEVSYTLARPDNREKGASTFFQSGYMQILLKYAGGAGPGEAWARARAIRSIFNPTASFTADGVTTNIDGSPQILGDYNDADGRFVLPVRVFFNAQLPN